MHIYINKKFYTTNNKVMCEKDTAIKEADAPTQSIHNEDHGKVINFIYILMQYREIYIIYIRLQHR